MSDTFLDVLLEMKKAFVVEATFATLVSSSGFLVLSFHNELLWENLSKTQRVLHI